MTCMASQRKPKPHTLLGEWAFIGTFLLLPVWDALALAHTLQRSLRIRRLTMERDAATPFLLQTIRRLVLLVMAFGIVQIGLRRLTPSASQIATVATPYLLNSLRLLVVAWMTGGLLVALLLGLRLGTRRLARRSRWLGLILDGLVRIGSSIMAAPVSGISLIALLVLGVRYGWLPVTPAGVGTADLPVLLLSGLFIAALPALVAAESGIRAWDNAFQQGLLANQRRAILGLSVSQAFANQMGWLLGSLVIVEAVFGLDGVGRLLNDAAARGNMSALAGLCVAFPPVLLVAHVHTTLVESARRSYLLTLPYHPDAGTTTVTATLHRVNVAPRLAIALFLLLAPLAVSAWGWRTAGKSANLPDPAAIYAPRSPEHPLGTDHTGRDVAHQLANAQLATWGIALLAGLVALGLGGAWNVACRAASRWPGAQAEVLADLLRFPAAVLILWQPVLIGLLWGATTHAPSHRFSGLEASVVIGLLLVPRAAVALGCSGRLPSGPPKQWLPGAAVTALGLATFTAMQYSVAVGSLLGSVLPATTLGTMLLRYQELVVGAQAVTDGRFVWLAIYLAGPAIATAAGAYLLQDALADRFIPTNEAALPRLLG